MNPLADTIEVWCPTWPRRVGSRQRWVDDAASVARRVERTQLSVDNQPYISTYGFPSGHPKDGNVPAIDCLFVDFDIPNDGEYRSRNPDPSAWYRDMSALLTRVREVCRLLVREGRDHHFRAALSGHKGVHLYLDFPVLNPMMGTVGQFKVGLAKYADELIAYFESETGLDLQDWVDVDSSDLARLCRLPNTLHPTATQAFDEDRYCVPVSVRELATIKPNEYVTLTRDVRPVPDGCRRSPNEKAAGILTQYIRGAKADTSFSGSRYDPKAVKQYDEDANDSIELSDIPLLTSNKPCIWAFRERDDKFNHGAASHAMELNVIAHLVERRVPVPVILEYFSNSEDYDEDYTREQVNTVIAHQYHEFRCETIWQQAPQFCLEGDCRIYVDEYEDHAADAVLTP